MSRSWLSGLSVSLACCTVRRCSAASAQAERWTAGGVCCALPQDRESQQRQQQATQRSAGLRHTFSPFATENSNYEICRMPTCAAPQLDAAQMTKLSPDSVNVAVPPRSANRGSPRMISNRMKTKSMMAPPGKRIRLKDFDPAFKGGYASHAHAQSKLKANIAAPGQVPGPAVFLAHLCPAADPAGHGCGRQRQHHQARDVGRQSRKAARSSASRRRRSTNSATTFCGGPIANCRNAATSASSIVRTTKRCWWCECIPSCSSRNICPASPRPTRSSGSIASSRSTTWSATWFAMAP